MGVLMGSARVFRSRRGTPKANGTEPFRMGAALLFSVCVVTLVNLPPWKAVAGTAQEEPAVIGAARESRAAAGSNPNRAAAEVDHDESPEGKRRIREIEERAKQLVREHDLVERERRPFLVRRDSMLGEVSQARERIARSQVGAVALGRQITQLEQQIRWTTGPEAKQLQTQQSRLKTTLNSLVRKRNADQELIDERMTQVNALTTPLASLDQRLQRLEEELSESRSQWLKVRQPLEKYARGDFEGLRRVLDDWLVMDGQWPEAFSWAALCAFELDDVGAALSYLQKAQTLRVERSGSKKKWPSLEALSALIRQKQPGQLAKSETALTNALSHADKNSDWETYFLVGRYYCERPNDGVRAKTYLQRALAIQPGCDCAKLWLARIQTVSTISAVRDLDAGTAGLEHLWEKNSHKSWRLAWFLAEAYSASQRTEDAEAMWRTAGDLAPDQHRIRLVRGGRKPE